MPAVVVASIIGAGASLGSSALASRSANKAAKQQQDSATQANNLLQRAQDAQVARMQPFLNAGQQALPMLSQIAGSRAGMVIPGQTGNSSGVPLSSFAQRPQMQPPMPMLPQGMAPNQPYRPFSLGQIAGVKS